MKTTITTLSLLLAGAVYSSAFSTGLTFVKDSRIVTQVSIGKDPNVQLGGNTWRPDSAGMRSTDVGDYFPEGYNPDDAFSEGMLGGSGTGSAKKTGPALPGMENLGADAIMMGGIAEASEIPADMKFIPSSVPDFTLNFQVAASGSAHIEVLTVKPPCMTYEDYYAAFSSDSHRAFSVAPQFGRMDRRGGEPTMLKVIIDPRGQAGELVGNLVINLPEDNSKICYKITARSF